MITPKLFKHSNSNHFVVLSKPPAPDQNSKRAKQKKQTWKVSGIYAFMTSIKVGNGRLEEETFVRMSENEKEKV